MKNEIFKVCVLGLVAVTLSTGCTTKEGEIIKIKRGDDSITISKNTSNEDDPTYVIDIKEGSNSNISESSNSNIKSNITNDLNYDIKKNKDGNKEYAVITATSNNEVVWKYKTGLYNTSTDELFTLHVGERNVYIAEDGYVKALNKTTGEVEWTTKNRYGQNITLFEDDNSLLIAPSLRFQTKIYFVYSQSGKEFFEYDLKDYDLIKDIKCSSHNLYSMRAHSLLGGDNVVIEYNYSTGKVTVKNSTKQKLTITSMNGTGEKVVYEVDKYARQLDGSAGYNNVYYFINNNELYYVSPAEPSKKILISHDAIDVLYDYDLGFVGIVDSEAKSVSLNTKSEIDNYNNAISKITILKINNSDKLTVRNMDTGKIRKYDVDNSSKPNQGAAGLTNNNYYVKNNTLYYVMAVGEMNPVKIATGVKYVSFIDDDNYSGFVAVADSNFKYVNENNAYLLKVINK